MIPGFPFPGRRNGPRMRPRRLPGRVIAMCLCGAFLAASCTRLTVREDVALGQAESYAATLSEKCPDAKPLSEVLKTLGVSLRQTTMWGAMLEGLGDSWK